MLVSVSHWGMFGKEEESVKFTKGFAILDNRTLSELFARQNKTTSSLKRLFSTN